MADTTLPDVPEVKLMEGVYMTDFRRRPAAESTVGGAPTVLGTTGYIVDGNILLAEADRLRNSIQHLLRSNQELQSADPDDPDFQAAIRENQDVILNQTLQLKKIEEELKKIEDRERGSATKSSPADDGLYL
eukprot:GILK01007739.1.p1 GENE.GILK01007739.1~~GILK01007739.1.p1  ORF type:complete len:143 (+),score=28.43 GILK01007739.1:36-431(+)